jgi:hypothetical protein
MWVYDGSTNCMKKACLSRDTMMAGMRVEISNYSLGLSHQTSPVAHNLKVLSTVNIWRRVLRVPPTAPGSVREPSRLEIEKRD